MFGRMDSCNNGPRPKILKQF